VTGRGKGALAARPEIREFQAYTLALPPIAKVLAKLDFNESPFDVPDELKEIVLSRLAKRRWAHYPEFGAPRLTEAIAAEAGRPAEEVVVGNGSGELVLAAITVFAGNGGRLLLAPPTFSLYRQLAVLTGAGLIEVRRPAPDFPLDEREFLRAAEVPGTVPLVCSPNNPTGTVTAPAFLDRLCAASGVVLADQAYVDFADPDDDARPILDRVPNLVIFRTLSKAFSAAGFRIGYALAPAPVAAEIRKAVLPFSVDAAAEELAIALMENPAFSKRSIETVRAQREALAASLRALGAVVAPSRSNFLFFTLPGTGGPALAAGLARRGVLVRELSSAAEGYLRVTVGSAEENAIFLDALKEAR
jgi:histidinol-phosphate aminotransferase